jgi:hypothetical protein
VAQVLATWPYCKRRKKGKEDRIRSLLDIAFGWGWYVPEMVRGVIKRGFKSH